MEEGREVGNASPGTQWQARVAGGQGDQGEGGVPWAQGRSRGEHEDAMKCLGGV